MVLGGTIKAEQGEDVLCLGCEEFVAEVVVCPGCGESFCVEYDCLRQHLNDNPFCRAEAAA